MFPDRPLSSDIAEYYGDSEQALKQYFSPLSIDFSVRLAGYTHDEVELLRDSRLEELDKAAAFAVLTSLEASFRVDYLVRCSKRKKDTISQAFRKLYKTKRDRAYLEDDLLATWKIEMPAVKPLISQLLARVS